MNATSINANTSSPAAAYHGQTLDLFTTDTPAPPVPRLAVPVFGVRLVRERSHETMLIRTPADAARLCCELLDGSPSEVFLAIALSTASRVIGAHVCHIGTIDASIASPRDVYRFALLVNARSVLVAHNHPSGNLEPSSADVAVSRQLKDAGEAIGIPLVDSVVCGFDGRYTSLVERGMI